MGEHGKGTRWAFTETRKDGTIRRRVRVGLTIRGKRVWRTAKDDRDADRILARLIEARDVDLDPTRQTLAAYLRSWIESQRELARKGRGLRVRTLNGYEALIEQRIIPELGGITLARLTKRRVQAWLNGQDGSAGTVRNAHAVLRKALQGAAGDVIPSNPALGVELPRRPAFEGSPMTEDEVRRLLSATEGDWLHPLWRLAVVTGLREGELLGLSREAIDGTTLRVDGQLQRIDGRWIIGPTKAARSLKRLTLDSGTVAVLQAHLRKMAEARKPGWRYFGLMFVTPQGQPYHQSTILAEFRKACDKAGIEGRRFHDLRHTANRLLEDRGVSEAARMARLGHATTRMSRHYGGASAEMDRAAADAMAKVADG